MTRPRSSSKAASDLTHPRRLPAEFTTLFDHPPLRRILKNGVTLLHQPDHAHAMASVQWWVKTGSIHEAPLLGSGLSHYLEHMVFKGTRRRGPGEIAREAQELGGHLNAYTTFDRTVYYLDLPSENLAPALDLLTDMVFNATLPEEEMAREKDVILREIDMSDDDPDRRVGRALFETAYRAHPYRYPIIGLRELFEAVTADELRRYFTGRYSTDNAVLAVAGDVGEEDLQAALDKSVEGLVRRRQLTPHIPAEPGQLARRESHLTGDYRVCRGGLGYRIPGLVHEDSPGLDMLAAVLGRGQSSLLWQELREKRRLVHQIDALTWVPGGEGLFWISYMCDQDKAGQVAAAVREVLGRAARQGLPGRLLEKVRRQAWVSEINARKTASGQAGRLGMAEVVAGDLDYPKVYFQRLAALHAADFSPLIRKYLVEERLTDVTLAPATNGHTAKRAAAPATLPDFSCEERRNGSRLLMQPDRRLPKIHLRLVGLGGPCHEAPTERGLTAMLTTLMARDTLRRSACEVAEAIESVGGALNEFSGNNSFGLSVEVMPSDLPLALELLQEAVLLPAFLEETAARERDALRAQIEENLDDIVDFGRHRLRHLFFGDHPYRSENLGELETIEALTVAAVRNHYRRLVCGPNLVLAAAGDFDPDELGPVLREWCDALPKGRPLQDPPVFHGPPRADQFEAILPREQAVVFLAFPDCGIRAPEYTAGELLDELFSDMAGRLFLRVREESGLAYFVGAQRITGLTTGVFYLYGGTQPGTAPQVLDHFRAEIERTRSGGITPAELERCRTRLRAQRRSQHQVIGSRAMQASLDTLYGLSPNWWRGYDNRLANLRLEDVHQFAQRFLDPEQAVALTVHP